MKFLFDIAGGDSNIRSLPVHTGGSTAMKAGAAIIRGATGGTNNCFGVLGAANNALADILGVLEAAVAATPDSNINGTANLFAKACVNPFGVFLAEYAQDSANNVAATSASSGTTVNLTSIENMSGGWLYVASGTGIGQLEYVTAGASNTATTKTAFSPALDTTSYLVKVLADFEETVAITADGTKLQSIAAAGAGAARIVSSYIQYTGQEIVRLDPTLHSGLTGLNSQNLHLYSAIMFLDHAFNIGA